MRMDSSDQRCSLELRSEMFQVVNKFSCNVGSCMIHEKFRNDRTRSTALFSSTGKSANAGRIWWGCKRDVYSCGPLWSMRGVFSERCSANRKNRIFGKIDSDAALPPIA